MNNRTRTLFLIALAIPPIVRTLRPHRNGPTIPVVSPTGELLGSLNLRTGRTRNA